MIPRKKIISLYINCLPYGQAILKITALARSRSSAYVCFVNAHMSVEAYRDSSFARMINQAFIVAPDGMPVVRALEFFYNTSQQRIAGMDVMESLFPVCEQEQLPVFLFGSSPENLRAIEERLNREHPALQIAGSLSPDPDAFTPDDNEKYIGQINRSGAGIVLVALGCPKQEKWMAAHYSKISAVLLGVGGAFPVYGGFRRRAPLWLRNLSLEWLFRLMQEPGRMFKRYAVTNSWFLLLMIRQWSAMKRSKGTDEQKQP